MRPIAFLAAVLGVGIVSGLVLAGDPAPEAPSAPPSRARAVFPPDWFFYGENPQRLALLQRLNDRPAPEIDVREWLVGPPTTMLEQRGNIVVLDFWGTWCNPCLQALPHTNSLAAEYADQGVTFIAICDDSKGANRAPDVVKQLNLTFRVAVDNIRGSYRAYLGQWFPFYVIVDRAGAVRGSGFNPESLKPAIDALLVEQPFGEPVTPLAPLASAPAAKSSGPPPAAPAREWLEGTQEQRGGLSAVQGQQAHALNVIDWLNADPVELSQLKGKVVLLDFWGTWCPQCLQSVPYINQLQERYGPDGLVVIGVCHSKESAKMPEIAKKYGIKYPIAADTAGATFKSFRVNGTPDYYLIDRAGVVRFADVANQHIEDAIRLLLNEAAPPAQPVSH